MTSGGFKSVDEMWRWVQSRSLSAFIFLVHDFGFGIARSEVTPTQCSVEYNKNGIRIGIWCEYGTRPEVFIEAGGGRVFTNQLIAQYAKGLNLPVKATVFAERSTKDEYRSIIEAYAALIKVVLNARDAPGPICPF